MSHFTGKSALVTGAASGIGAACARRLDAQGIARLVMIDRAEVTLDLSCAADIFTGDVGDPEFWSAIEPRIGAIDHAVINAGVASGSPIAETEFDEWRRVLGVNLDGAFLTMRAAIRTIREYGSIVVTASVSGLKAEPGTAAYGASKAGAIQLTKVAAKEGAPRGVRVNAIAPGGVDTPIWDQTPFFNDLVASHGEDRTGALTAMAKMATPLGRFASAEEIAAQVGFLLSDAAANITGAVLVCDGGYSL